MLIVLAQNKIWIGKYVEFLIDGNKILGYPLGNKEPTILGIYKTQVRAIQVFKEIAERIKVNLHNKMYQNQPDEMYNCDPYYEMPEE